MLDHSECAEPVIFEFKEPIVVIEGSGPLQERHWLELIEHRATQNSKNRQGTRVTGQEKERARMVSRPYN